MRSQAVSRSSIDVAKLIRKFGDRPNAAPNTTATFSSSKSDNANSSSLEIIFPEHVFLPINLLISG